jgi:DGQHR domain-containing protein
MNNPFNPTFSAMSKQIDVRALKISQTGKIPLYSFFLRGGEILDVADISRVKRNESGGLLGYQRGEVSHHIDEITNYLDSGDVIFPNAIILAMSSAVKFKQSRGPKVGEHSTQSGVLTLPIGAEGSKVAWIVDGQQRTMALSKAKKKSILVPVTAFVSDDFEIHRGQFLLVNKVKPLPKGLINELLPTVNTALPPSLTKAKIPSAICDMLDRDPESPFCGLLIRVTTDRKKDKKAVIQDNSLLLVIKDSLYKPHGCLYQHRNVATGEIDVESVMRTINLFWNEVKKTFPEAWGVPSTKSRLMSGVGIKSMGVLMDRIMANLHPGDPKAPQQVKEYLDRLKPYCAWTSGNWEILGGVAWDDPQNTPKDISKLSHALVRAYVQVE